MVDLSPWCVASNWVSIVKFQVKFYILQGIEFEFGRGGLKNLLSILKDSVIMLANLNFYRNVSDKSKKLEILNQM